MRPALLRRRALLAAPALIPGAAAAQAPAVQQDDILAPGWRRGVLIRWGDRVSFDAPPFDPRNPDADAAATQFGWDARAIGLVAPPAAADGVARAVLAVAHPNVEAALAFPGGRDRPGVAGALGGATLLNLEVQRGRWVVVDGGFQARRLTNSTLCRLGSEAVRGVAGIQGGGVTPWGTLLLAEGESDAWAARLGTPAQSLGWVAELDPLDPQSVPAKRAACGRLPLRGDVTAALARDGRGVVFQTQRAPGGFLLRCVTQGPAREADALEAGTLSAAVFEGGRVRFVPLPPEAVATSRDVAALARAAGATPLDLPCGVGWDAQGRRLVLCLRGTQAGSVLALRPDGGDAADASFSIGTLAQGTVPNPDAVGFDGRGRALVGTDQGGRGASADALWLIEGGSATPIYAAARGAAVGGAAVTPDGGTIIAAARMPGRGPGASFERPATRWPEFVPGQPPRSALVALTR